MIKFRSHILLFALALLSAFISVTAYNRNYNQICDKINLTDEIFIECKITSFPRKKNDKISFCAKILSCDQKDLVGEGIFVSSKNITHIPSKGDTISLKSKLQLAQTNGNEGAFDYRNYLKSLDVAAVCYPDEFKTVKTQSGFLKTIYNVRQSFIENCDKYIIRESSGLVKAVITGERTGISTECETAFKQAGIYHIVAISGLHLNLLVYGVYYAIAKLKLKRMQKAILSFAASVMAGAFVLIFTGFGVSVIRAFIMMAILGGGAIMPREYSAKNALMIAGFGVIITMPYCFYSVALWLSFLSTFGVLVSADTIKTLKEKRKAEILTHNYVGNTFIVSSMTTLFCLPVTASVFGYVPTYSWITNAFVLPVMSLFMGLGIAFAFVSALLPEICAKTLGYALTAAGQYIITAAKTVASLPLSSPEAYPTDIAVLAIAFIIFILCFNCIRHRAFKTFAFLIAIIVLAGTAFLLYNKSSDTMTVTFADVGQGDCAIAEIDGRCIMIDCGTQGESEYIAASVEAMLRAKNIKKLDMAIVSHFHNDHVNILGTLVKNGKVRVLVLPRYYDFREKEAKENKEMLLASAACSNTKVEYVSEGSVIEFTSDAKIEVLSPTDDAFWENNDMSLILRLTHGKTRAMFFGDADKNALEKCAQNDIECDIIKMPHHGGHCEMSERIINACNAQAAVISCAIYNNYGHPDERVLRYLEDNDCEIYRTDEMGAVCIKADKNANLKISVMR